MKRLSAEEMNKVLLEKVSLDERLRAVYLPITVMDCACYLSEDLLTILRTLRLDATKEVSRAIRNCISGYRNANCCVMRSLYRGLSNLTKGFYDSLSQDMAIYRLQYQQAILNRKITLSAEMEKLVAMGYVVRELVRFALRLDRNFSKRISDLLGKGMAYATEDNHYCLEMVKTLDRLFVILGVPDDLRTDQTDMAFRVFRNRLNSIKYDLPGDEHGS